MMKFSLLIVYVLLFFIEILCSKSTIHVCVAEVQYVICTYRTLLVGVFDCAGL